MMVIVPLTGAFSREFVMPIPSPLRDVLRYLFLSLVAAAVYVDIQAAIMIYDYYQILQWLGELSTA